MSSSSNNNERHRFHVHMHVDCGAAEDKFLSLLRHDQLVPKSEKFKSGEQLLCFELAGNVYLSRVRQNA